MPRDGSLHRATFLHRTRCLVHPVCEVTLNNTRMTSIKCGIWDAPSLCSRSLTHTFSQPQLWAALVSTRLKCRLQEAMTLAFTPALVDVGKSMRRRDELQRFIPVNNNCTQSTHHTCGHRNPLPPIGCSTWTVETRTIQAQNGHPSISSWCFN